MMNILERRQPDVVHSFEDDEENSYTVYTWFGNEIHCHIDVIVDDDTGIFEYTITNLDENSEIQTLTSPTLGSIDAEELPVDLDLYLIEILRNRSEDDEE